MGYVSEKFPQYFLWMLSEIYSNVKRRRETHWSSLPQHCRVSRDPVIRITEQLMCTNEPKCKQNLLSMNTQNRQMI